MAIAASGWRSPSGTRAPFGVDVHWLLMGGVATARDARPVPVVKIAAAAGGSAAGDERETGRIWFPREWLVQHGIDPARCVVISVAGESMEPTLPDRCSILVDRARTERREGRLYAIRSADGLVVKRARRLSTVADGAFMEQP